jgi:DNA replication protein DnaC
VSLVVTSNKNFESWADDFPDAVIASAVLHRLVHHAHLVFIIGDSYRMKDHKAPQNGASIAKKSA